MQQNKVDDDIVRDAQFARFDSGSLEKNQIQKKLNFKETAAL